MLLRFSSLFQFDPTTQSFFCWWFPPSSQVLLTSFFHEISANRFDVLLLFIWDFVFLICLIVIVTVLGFYSKLMVILFGLVEFTDHRLGFWLVLSFDLSLLHRWWCFLGTCSKSFSSEIFYSSSWPTDVFHGFASIFFFSVYVWTRKHISSLWSRTNQKSTWRSLILIDSFIYAVAQGKNMELEPKKSLSAGMNRFFLALIEFTIFVSHNFYWYLIYLAMSNLDMPSLLSRSSEAFNGGSGYPSASDLSMFSSSLPTLFHEKRMS